MAGSEFEYVQELPPTVVSLSDLVDFVTERHLRAAGAAQYIEAEQIMNESREIVPVGETGALLASAAVGDPEYTATSVEVEMGYGGAAASSSIVQHETPTVGPDEPKGPFVGYEHAEGKSDKFLERPFNEAALGMESRIADRMRRELGDLL